MLRHHVESAALQSIGYNHDSETLELEFRDNGGIWQYYNFPVRMYKKFLKSESLGNFFVTKIKNKYREARVEQSAKV
jgi:hypothetical protein